MRWQSAYPDQSAPSRMMIVVQMAAVGYGVEAHYNQDPDHNQQ